MKKEREIQPKRIKVFFSYFGGKYRISKKYPAPFLGNTIVEPFAGAAGYSTMYYNNPVKLFDLYPVIVDLWKYLIDCSYSKEENGKFTLLDTNNNPLPLNIESGQSISDLPIESNGARNLIGFWLGRGSAIPAKKPGTWMRSGEYNSSFWGPHIHQRVASQVEKVRDWEIEEMSYLDIPESLKNDPNITWYIDPPYQVAGTTYKKSASDLDYEGQLVPWILSLKGQVIVCENKGAPWIKRLEQESGIDSVVLSELVSTRKKVTIEIIWTNDDEWAMQHKKSQTDIVGTSDDVSI